MSSENVSPVADAERRRKDLFQEIRAAHEDYFDKLNKAWLGYVEPVQKLQTDYEAGANEAWLKRDAAALQAACERFQRDHQSACESNTKLYAEAYAQYKAATQRAFANANMDAVDPLLLATISQSLAIVANSAQLLGCSAPAPASQAAA